MRPARPGSQLRTLSIDYSQNMTVSVPTKAITKKYGANTYLSYRHPLPKEKLIIISNSHFVNLFLLSLNYAFNNIFAPVGDTDEYLQNLQFFKRPDEGLTLEMRALDGQFIFIQLKFRFYLKTLSMLLCPWPKVK